MNSIWKISPYRAQLKSIFGWLSGMVRHDDIVLVDLPGCRGYFYFEFPLHGGDSPKRKRSISKGEEVTFVIRTFNQEKILAEPWIKIFNPPKLEIFAKQANPSPTLRWRLNKEEKETALKIARNALEFFLSNGQRSEQQYLRTLPASFYLKSDLDVALWVDGRLRGSAVVENRHLGEGITEAVIMASRDRRFKPLTTEELPCTRIEITLMHDLRIPLSRAERTANRIYHEKGYVLSLGERRGWYLPEVFNVRRFRNLEEFLGDLAQEKAKLDRSAFQKADVFIFEVDDFIESADHLSVLELCGPIVKNNSVIPDHELMIPRLRTAADWLCQIQEPDGNMPPIIDPLTGRQTQIDWPRLAFTAWALAEFGKAVNKKKYIEAAQKSFEYLRLFIITRSRPLIPSYELTLAYFGQLALTLSKPDEAMDVANKICSRLGTLNFEPITHAQIASFLKVISKSSENFSVTFQKLGLIIKENFEKQLQEKKSMNLAVWAELVNTFSEIDQEFSDKVADWLKNQQLPSGAFPESTVSDFVYIRGTGKIFEVLALGSDKNKETTTRALAWLFSMQYNEENTFFVPAALRTRVLGGFRHDGFNHEAWIDAAGHVLLGGVRFLENTKIA